MKLHGLQRRSTTEFFNSDYVDFASYDNIRKIASLVDGQKNASRKILWYTQQKNQKNEIKVSQLDSKVSEFTEYLHGSMSQVIINLAQDYTGTNNINLMSPEGNFGTTLIPEASAPRYIYSYGTNEFFDIFSKEDDAILEHQYFEGHQIEPRFMIPKIPMLLVNGTEGISSGFSSKILPRNPKEIQKYLEYRLSHPTSPHKPFQNKPWYQGFQGTVNQGEEKHKWTISGVLTRKANKVHITELPVGYSLKGYLKVLDKLEDDKKIITYSDNTTKGFDFTVQFNRKYLDSLNDLKLMELLKLNKKVAEQYTVMDENNRVQQLKTPDEIMQRYIKVKMEYLNKRKSHQIKTISAEIREMISKYVFIKAIVDETLIIFKRPDKDIMDDLDKMDKIIKVDNEYSYLLNMNIRSLTESRMVKLLNQIKEAKAKLDTLKSQTIEEIWLGELK